jgi:hypothetical protein
MQDTTEKKVYLIGLAGWTARSGNVSTAEGLADYFFARSDFASARRVLYDATTLSLYANGQTTPLFVTERMLRRVIATKQNMEVEGDTYTSSAMAMLARASMDYARKLADDSSFGTMPGQVQDAVVGAIMNVDPASGVALAVTLPDSQRADAALARGASQMINAGLIEGGLQIAARIRTPSQRGAPLSQAVQRMVQNGDTTGVRAIVREVLNNANMRNDYWNISYSLIPAAIKAGMLDELLSIASRMSDDRRAFLLVALLTKLGT